MRNRLIPTIALLIVTATVAAAQTMPEQPPSDTTIGGSGASRHALEELGSAAGPVKVLNNIQGPSEGRDRNRTEINQFPIPPNELGGLTDYYLRSSYVTLGPKGFAPLHSHDERPAFLQVVSGAIHQHRSDGTSFVMGYGDFTFSSDGLAHWWINDRLDTEITLWIVELCTAAHGCEAEVTGGATQLATSQSGGKIEGSELVMSIDLAGEFPNATGFGDRQFNLRRHDIAPGETLDLAALGPNVAYVRLFSGNLSIDATGETITEGAVYLSNKGAAGSWSNKASDPATLYSIEFEAG